MPQKLVHLNNLLLLLSTTRATEVEMATLLISTEIIDQNSSNFKQDNICLNVYNTILHSTIKD